LYEADEAGRGPEKNDKPVRDACQPCVDVNMFIHEYLLALELKLRYNT
jgi:hypothetical protein